MKKLLFAFLLLTSYLLPLTSAWGQANTYWHDRIDTTIYATTTGTNTYTGTNLNTNFNVARYNRGLLVSTFIVNGNTGAATYRLVTASGTLATAAIKKQNGTALSSGDIPDSSAVLLMYYGNFWRLMGVHGMSSTAWMLTGNAGTTAGTNFLGTTDSVNLILKTNNIERARFTRQGGQLQMADGGTIPATVLPLQLGYFATSNKYYTLNVINTFTATTPGVGGGGVGISTVATGSGGNTNVGLLAGANNASYNYGLAMVDGSPVVGVNNWSIFDSSAAQIYFRPNVGIGVVRPSSLLHVNGVTRFGLASTTNASLIFQNSTNANTLTINSGVTSASHAWTLPLAQGAANTALTNNGSGVLSWATAATLGAWVLDGNTVGSEKFIGTLDNFDFPVRVNNVEKLRLKVNGQLVAGTGTNNLYIGLDNGLSWTTAVSNTGIGRQSLKNVSTSSYNTGVGEFTLGSITTGVGECTAVGYYALGFNTTGFWNVAMGVQALRLNSSGQRNTAVGHLAMEDNLTNSYGTAVGAFALRHSKADGNTGMGYGALEFDTTGFENSGFGQNALYNIDDGDYNTAIGNTAGYDAAGDRNIFIGNFSGRYFTGSNSFYVGSYLQVNLTRQNNLSLIRGTQHASDSSQQILRVNASLGINIAAPTAALHVVPLASTMVGIKTSGRITASQGANVTAANDLTLGYGGNSFLITGNTQINAITSTDWQAGSQITLVFSGTPTVKNETAGGAGTAQLFLAGDADFAATADDLLGLIYETSCTCWREIYRTVH